ncbi:MAG: hypothetical protein V1824_03000, partial [archaeon]
KIFTQKPKDFRREFEYKLFEDDPINKPQDLEPKSKIAIVYEDFLLPRIKNKKRSKVLSEDIKFALNFLIKASFFPLKEDLNLVKTTKMKILNRFTLEYPTESFFVIKNQVLNINEKINLLSKHKDELNPKHKDYVKNIVLLDNEIKLREKQIFDFTDNFLEIYKASNNASQKYLILKLLIRFEYKLKNLPEDLYSDRRLNLIYSFCRDLEDYPDRRRRKILYKILELDKLEKESIIDTRENRLKKIVESVRLIAKSKNNKVSADLIESFIYPWRFYDPVSNILKGFRRWMAEQDKTEISFSEFSSFISANKNLIYEQKEPSEFSDIYDWLRESIIYPNNNNADYLSLYNFYKFKFFLLDLVEIDRERSLKFLKDLTTRMQDHHMAKYKNINHLINVLKIQR